MTPALGLAARLSTFLAGPKGGSNKGPLEPFPQWRELGSIGNDESKTHTLVPMMWGHDGRNRYGLGGR